jgi:integrase
VDTLKLGFGRRVTADRWRAVAKAGRDPVKEREREAREAMRAMHTLKAVALEAFEARKAELKGDGKAGRWFSPLEIHVLPKLGGVPVAELDQRDIRDALAPIWHTKGPTAEKVLEPCRNRSAPWCGYGLGRGPSSNCRQGPRPSRESRGTSSEEHPRHAVAADVPAFYASLTEQTPTHLALRLLILTGVRTGPLRHLRLDHDRWRRVDHTGEAMKGRKGADARLPRAPVGRGPARDRRGAPVRSRRLPFREHAQGGIISDMTLSRHMERRGMEARPHGFRHPCATWLAEATNAPHEVAEAMLGHVADSGVVRAYRRTDFLEQRRALAERWADHVTGGAGRVVKLAAGEVDVPLEISEAERPPLRHLRQLRQGNAQPGAHAGRSLGRPCGRRHGPRRPKFDRIGLDPPRFPRRDRVRSKG